jgi:very-short-patch-repair endonuclease
MRLRSLVEPLAREQHGIVTRRDLRGLGVGRSRIARAVRRGELVRRHRGVYALPETPLDPDLNGKALQMRGVVSHDTAARWWGMELVHTPEVNHLTVARNRGRGRDSVAGWRLHRADLVSADKVVHRGLCVTTPVRTVLDCARLLPFTAAVALADSALRKRLVTMTALQRSAAALPRGPGRRKAQQVISLLDPKADSVLESLLRILLWENGLLPPESQYVIRNAAGTFVGYFDFAWPALRLVIEAEGFEFHGQREHLRRDCRRHNVLTLQRWWLLRFTWEDVVLFPESVIETVRDALTAAASHQAAVPLSTQPGRDVAEPGTLIA